MVVQLIYNNRLDNEVHRLALSYNLALKAENLDTQILTVVSSLRGFELTGTEANLTALEAAKKRAYELNDEMIAVWSRMGASRKDQLERAEKIKVLFNVLLKEVVERLKGCVRESDTISRQGGDEFIILLNDVRDGEAIGTSGDYQRFFELDGKRYCHLLDPQSGEPVTHTQALTVLVSSRPAAGTLSDAASKPLFIAGPEWPAAARKMGVDQVLRIDSGGRVQVSGKLKARLEFIAPSPGELEILP